MADPSQLLEPDRGDERRSWPSSSMIAPLAVVLIVAAAVALATSTAAEIATLRQELLELRSKNDAPTPVPGVHMHVHGQPTSQDDMQKTKKKRSQINPVAWGEQYYMSQGEVIEDSTGRRLRCSGQVAVTDDGTTTVAQHDMCGQVNASLAAIDAILDGAEMARSDVVFVRFFTTNVDEFLRDCYTVYADWIKGAGVMPPQSLIGVRRLYLPDMMVEIEVEAET